VLFFSFLLKIPLTLKQEKWHWERIMPSLILVYIFFFAFSSTKQVIFTIHLKE